MKYHILNTFIISFVVKLSYLFQKLSEISIGITLEEYEKCSKNGNYYDLYTGEIICINYAFKLKIQPTNFQFYCNI